MDPSKGAQIGYFSIAKGVEVDDYKMIVINTTCIGSFLAILCTFVPSPHLNLKSALNDVITTAHSMNQIWGDAIVYYYGNRRSAKRFQIETKIDALQEVVSRISQNLDDAWWECFGSSEHARQQMAEVCRNMKDTYEVMYAVRTCILNETFQQNTAFACKMTMPMMQLRDEAAELALLCVFSAYRGQHGIQHEERQLLRRYAACVRSRQQELAHTYQEVSRGWSTGFRPDADVCVFALSFSARKIADIGDLVANSSLPYCKPHLFERCWKAASELRQVWAPKRVLDPEHVNFCLRNFFAVSFCFAIGFFCEGPLIQRYSPVMPNTVALLIGNSRYKGTAVHKNIQRFLGVTLGMVLPILLSLGVELSGSFGETFPSIARFLMIWLYVSLCCYICFTSTHWKYVSCLVGAFGIYPLLDPDADKRYAERYAHIGQVTLASCVQAFFEFAFTRATTSDLAVAQLAGIGQAFQTGYVEFYQQSLDGMQRAARNAAKCLTIIRATVPECDPKLKLLYCFRTPFNQRLLENSVGIMQSLLSDLNMLIIAAKDWAPNVAALEGLEDEGVSAPGGVLEALMGRPAMNEVHNSMTSWLETVLTALLAILSHKTEDPLEGIDLEELNSHSLHEEFLHVDSMYTQIVGKSRDVADPLKFPEWSFRCAELTDDLQVRLLVATQALCNTMLHIGELHALCVKENIY